MPFEPEAFKSRHIGPDEAERDQMLKVVRAPSLDALIDEAIPPRIRLTKPLDLPNGQPEHQYLRDLRRILRTVIERKARYEDYPARYLIHHREEGARCPRCGGEIRRTVVFGRTTYFCAKHQR